MKKLSILLIALLAFGMQTVSAQDKIKIITFNVRSFEPDFDLTPYADLLRGEQADIIC